MGLKITKSPDMTLGAIGSTDTSAVGGVTIGLPGATGPGQGIVSSTSNTASWQPIVSTITSNGSNVLGPNVNFSSGSNISFAVTSNTLIINAVVGSIDHGGLAGLEDDDHSSYLLRRYGGGGDVQALGNLGATETLDLANANKFWGTLDQDCTISTTGWINLRDCQIAVELTWGTEGVTPTFSGVTWIAGTPGWTTTAGTVTHVVLFSRDGGTTIYGAVVGGSADGHWEPLTNSNVASPEMLFSDGDVLMTFVDD